MYHFSRVLVVACVLALCFNGIQAAAVIAFENATRIASTNPPIIGAAVIGSPTSCATQGLVYISSSSSSCLIFISPDGVGTTTSCDAAVAGSTAIACGPRYCHLANPVTHQIVIIDTANNGSVVRTYGSGIVTTPTAITVYEGVAPNANFFEMFIIDASDKALWYFKIRKVSGLPTGAITSQKLFTSTSTGAPVGAYRTAGTSGTLYLVFKGDTDIQTFQFTGSAFGNAQVVNTGSWPETFTSIGAFYMDYYERLFVHDSTCSCTHVYANYGIEVASISDESQPPTAITSSRNYIYFVDALGVLRYNEPPLQIVNTVFDKRCDTMLGEAEILRHGGAFPPLYYIYPEGISQEGTLTEWDVSDLVQFTLDVRPFTHPAILFQETVNMLFYRRQTDAVVGPVNSSVIPAYSGEYSYSVKFSTGGRFYWYCRRYGRCMSPQFHTIEFMLNVGKGGQSVRIDVFHDEYDPYTGEYDPELGKILATKFIHPGDYPLNNWTKVSIPVPLTYYTGIMFHELTGDFEQNPMYFDDVQFVADNSKRRVVVKDYCGVTVSSDEFEITNDNAFSVSLEATPSTCNIAQTANGLNSSDGTVTAFVKNGVAPFTYNWTFEGVDGSSDKVTNLTALTTYVTIYDNALNSSFLDSSDLTLRNFSDSRHYRSAPYSLSMTMVDGESSAQIKFSSIEDLHFYEGSTVSVWIYGSEGGQDIYFSASYRDNMYAYADLQDMLVGYPKGIPANIWVQAVYRFTHEDVQYSDFEYLVISELSFQQFGGAQQTLYMDDLIVGLIPAVKVYDSIGCSAQVNNLAILAPPPLQVSLKSTNALCHNTSSGTVSLGVTGGTAPYSIQYSVGSVKTRTDIVSVIKSLPEAQILVDVTDAHGCIATQAVDTILQPPPLSLSLSSVPVKCYGGSTSITSSISGGMAPYTYAWGATSPIALTPQPAPTPIFTDSLSLLYTLSSNANITCLGTGSQSSLSYPPTNSGYCSIFPTFSTSTPSMSITCPSISPTKFVGIGMSVYVATSADAQNLQISLAKGNTLVSIPVSIVSLGTITPASWNKIFFNVSNTTLTDQNPTQIVITSTAPTTMGRVIFDDIVLIPTVASSVGIIVYPGFKSVVSGNAGQYFLTVVDANGCSFTRQVSIDQPTELEIKADILHASSNSAKDGSIYVTALGGTPPYTFRWPDINIVGANASELSYGGYSVQVTDANGCVFTQKFTVQFEDRLTIRKYDSKLSGGLGAVVGAGALVGLFGLTMLIIYWKSFSKLGNFFSFVITTGVLVSYVAAFVLLPEPTDQLCVAFPWLLGIAFTFVYACLFLKTWALYRVWMKAIQYKKSTLTTMSILRTVGMVLLVEVAILAAWTAIDPPKVHLKKVEGNSLQAQCDTDSPTFWVIFMSVKGAWLIFGAVLSVLTRNLKKEYNESANIAYAIYTILILMAIAVPLAILLDVVPGGRLVIEIIVPVLAFTSTLIIMFFHTWKNSITGESTIKINHVGATGASTTAGYSTNTGSGSKASQASKVSQNSAVASNEINSSSDG